MGRNEMAHGLLTHRSASFDGLYSSSEVLTAEEQLYRLTFKTLV